jgi:hypothetical protein
MGLRPRNGPWGFLAIVVGAGRQLQPSNYVDLTRLAPGSVHPAIQENQNVAAKSLRLLASDQPLADSA